LCTPRARRCSTSLSKVHLTAIGSNPDRANSAGYNFRAASLCMIWGGQLLHSLFSGMAGRSCLR
jgi:hypothetical protein